MILFLEQAVGQLIEYGIHVPASPDRASRIVEALVSNREPGDIVSDWLQTDAMYVLTRDDLLLAHTTGYVEKILSNDPTDIVADAFELRRPDGSYNRYTPDSASRPLSELRDNRIVNAAGSYQCCRTAIEAGFSFYLGGGAHHAHPDFGHGFCIVNDAAIAVRRLQREKRIESAWIIDVDVHKGDGTAAIFDGDRTVTTLSVHMATGWPIDGPPVYPSGRANPSYIPSDIDVPIEAGEEAFYVKRLNSALRELSTRDLPDIAVVLLGADPYEHDALPSSSRLRLTLEQMGARDSLIHRFLEDLGLPQAYLMAGGYGERAWEPYPPFLEPILAKFETKRTISTDVNQEV